MRRPRVFVIAVLVLAVVVVVFLAVGALSQSGRSPVSVASDVVSETSSPEVGETPNPEVSDTPRSAVAVDCMKFDSDGDPLWEGPGASAEIRAAGDALSNLTYENPDIATGVSFCTDRNGVIFFTTEMTAKFERIVENLQSTLGKDESIRVEIRPFSQEELSSLQDSVGGQAFSSTEIRSIAPDFYTGGFVIAFSNPDSEATAVSVTLLGEAFREAAGENVPLRVVPAGPPVHFFTT